MEESLLLSAKVETDVPQTDVLVQLNVGGQLFTTHVWTLCQAEDTYFTDVLSGKVHIDRDADGRIFLGLDPACFVELLLYLRMRRQAMEKAVRPPNVKPEHKEAWTFMIDLLRLKECIYGSTVSPPMHEADNSAPTDDRLIELSVGGERFSTYKSTLCQAEGTYFTAMLSSSWESSLPKDSQGTIFLDFDPYCFTELLSYLRRCRLRGGQPGRPPFIKPDRRTDWDVMVDFLSLKQYIYGTPPTSLRMNIHSSGLSVPRNGNELRSSPSTGHRFAFCSTPLRTTTAWTVQITGACTGLFLGVIGKIRGGRGPPMTQTDSTAYGWGGTGSEVYIGGSKCIPGYGGWSYGFREGKPVYMKLNMEESLLEVHVTDRLKYAIDLPVDREEWFVHVNVYDGNSIVKIELHQP